MSDKQPSNISRREFVQTGASVAAIVASSKVWSGTSTTPTPEFEYGNPLREFGYGDVQFPVGVHQIQLDQTHELLMSINEDSLLRPFRMAAGVPAPGVDLGGWYSSDDWGPWNFGMWISALSRYYAITGDELTKTKVDRLLLQFYRTVEPTGALYRKSTDPGYLLMMITCGLMDAHQFVRNAAALGALSHTMDSALPYLPTKPTGIGIVDQDFIQIPDYQFIAWQRGANRKHLDLAIRALDDVVLEPLAGGENILPGRQVESHMEALCGAAKAYLVIGDEKYLRAAENGFAFVEAQSFATGAYGPDETFLPRPAEDYSDPITGEKKHEPALESLGDALIRTHNHFETPCCAYTHFRLTRYLLRITKNPAYGDSMERIMYNTVLGSLPLSKFGRAFYQSNYHSHARKDYFDGYGHIMDDEWPCCSGTLPQVAADYRISAYFLDQSGVFVNLYIPSTLRWEQHGTQSSLTQSGQYPLDDHVALEITTSKRVHCALRLRIPAWAEAPSIRINGKKITAAVQSGTFATLSRDWTSGDRIELELPRRLAVKPVDAQHPDMVALVSGPVVLFAVCDDTPKATRAQLLNARQRGTGSSEWTVDTDTGPLRLTPFWAISTETYFTYLSV